MSDNGGPAFPREDYQSDSAPGQSGMSLRDYAEVHFIAAWTVALAGQDVALVGSEVVAEAIELGRKQAAAWLAVREF